MEESSELEYSRTHISKMNFSPQIKDSIRHLFHPSLLQRLKAMSPKTDQIGQNIKTSLENEP